MLALDRSPRTQPLSVVRKPGDEPLECRQIPCEINRYDPRVTTGDMLHLEAEWLIGLASALARNPREHGGDRVTHPVAILIDEELIKRVRDGR
jgi:hypothetical protein